MGTFQTFPVKIPTDATDALHAIRQGTFMIWRRSIELPSKHGFVTLAVLCFNALGVEILKNCTGTQSSTLPDSSRSGLTERRLASLNAYARRRYRDGNLDISRRPSGQSTNLAEWRLLRFPPRLQHPELTSERSALR